MKTLVTGGRGFLGRRIVAALLAGGHAVAALDDGFRGTADLPPDADVHTADIRDLEAVENACAGCDIVVHLAAIQGTGNFYERPDLVLDVNLRGSLNVAQACAAQGVRRLFFSSSSECYGIPSVFPTPEDEPLSVPDPLNPRYSYGGSKIAGELVAIAYARRHGFEFTIARYHNVYGPEMGWDHVIPQFIRRLELGEEFTVQGDGRQTRSFCFVDDAVDATVTSLTAPQAAGEIFNIGNPSEEHSINALIAALERVSGKTIRPVHVPFDDEGTRRRVPDIGKARQLLGFDPRVTLDDGLRETYAWYVDALAEVQK